MKIWARIRRLFVGEAPKPPSRPVRPPRVRRQPPRPKREEYLFAQSLTEKRVLKLLAAEEPQTVKMIGARLDTTTANQALPAMWKRGVLVRRRQEGGNTYWYARSVDAFAQALPQRPIAFTESDRMRRDDWGRRCVEIFGNVQQEPEAADSENTSVYEVSPSPRVEGQADASTSERPDGQRAIEEAPEHAVAK
jgi:hypothetical protein